SRTRADMTGSLCAPRQPSVNALDAILQAIQEWRFKLGQLGKTVLDTAIIGAGPYGLSLAAHLKAAGVDFRIFGKPMTSWRDCMPKGMMLKSDGFASNLSAPDP